MKGIWRDESRKVYHSDMQGFGTGLSIDAVNAGSLQRIADAVERMATANEKLAANYDAMRLDRDVYARWYKEGRAREARMARSIAALRGHIGRIKRGKA